VINDLIKRLRKAADALDSLLEVDINSNIEAARLIGNKMDRKFNQKDRKNFIAKYTLKGEKKKKHWTQTRKGKKLLSRKMKKAWVTKREKA
jgi:hypothetical protein